MVEVYFIEIPLPASIPHEPNGEMVEAVFLKFYLFLLLTP